MRGPLALLIRRSLRSNRRAVLGLALVVALAGAVALTSLAGARRTSSAFGRYLEASNASDLAINPISDDNEGENIVDVSVGTILALVDQASRLPEVASDATYVGLEYTFILGDDGEPMDLQPEIVGSVDGRFFSQDRMAMLEGRLPSADAADEVAVNRSTAELLDVEIGSELDLVVPDLTGVDLGSTETDPSEIPILEEHTVRVTGVGLFPEEVLSDDFDGSPRVLVSPALTAAFVAEAGSYIWHGIRLTPGTSVAEGIRAYESVLPDGYQMNVQRTDTQVDRVQRAVRPVVVALAVFGVAAGLAALALGGLGAVRLMGATTSGDARALQAVGLAPRQRRILAAAPAVVASIAGATGAALLAVALSPLAPVGAVRDVEPDRGLDVDVLVIVAGGAGIALVLVGLAFVIAHRATRTLAGDATPTSRPAWTIGAMASAGFGPNAVVGAGHALGSGQRDGVPTRSTLAACTVSVVALASSITFGASVRTLLDRPAGYGWTADLAIHSGGGYDYLDPEGAERAAAVEGIVGFTVAGFATLSLEDREVNALGVIPVEGPPLITAVEGALPSRAEEVALGASTARELDVGIGDNVRSGDTTLRVVGIVALPAIGPIASAHPTLGQGALMTLDGLATLDQNAYPSLALVRLDDGLDPEREGPRLTTAVAGAMSESPPDFASYYVDLRPSEVVALGPASRTANLLAGLLGAAAVLALGLTLSASVRRRRRTYAVLSALGLDRADLKSTVRWQLNLVSVLALLVGIPLGVATGRLAWTAFADQLGVATAPQVPILLLAAAAVALLVVANVVGEWPARSAGRRGLVVSLRDD